MGVCMQVKGTLHVPQTIFVELAELGDADEFLAMASTHKGYFETELSGKIHKLIFYVSERGNKSLFSRLF